MLLQQQLEKIMRKKKFSKLVSSCQYYCLLGTVHTTSSAGGFDFTGDNLSEESCDTAIAFVVFGILESAIGFDEARSNKNQQILFGTVIFA